MRLWHYKLIPALPRKQLLAQWRECCAIAGKINKTGTPNHILVNVILEYSSQHFVIYCNMILDEMHKRGYKVSEKSYTTLCKNIEEGDKYFYHKGIIIDNEIYNGFMEARYLKQCFYNLQEKYDRGMITTEEYILLENKVKSKLKGE